MFCHRKHILVLLAALLLAVPVSAAEVDADQTYCFRLSDFSESTGVLSGICVTEVPARGSIVLGSRIIRDGDVLTTAQLEQLTFSPAPSAEDTSACISYLPIFPDGLSAEATVVISIRGKQDDPPVAEDSGIETYKNLPNEGQLKVTDPEGQPMTYTLVRAPKRGEVILREDGSFLYTPKNNKVGTDSFTYTAADPAGNVSREATVTITVLKPTDSALYTDTAGLDCRFEAEWLRCTGVFRGETISGQACFSPDEPVTRGQFLAMLMQVLELPVDHSAVITGFSDEAEEWLTPCLAAAYQAGIAAGYPCDSGMEFRSEQAITVSEAADMIQGALRYAAPAANWDPLPETAEPLTRADAACILYQVSQTRSEGIEALFGG